MKVLITGGCGFIGSHLAEALVAQGVGVVIFDNLSSGTLENIADIRSRVQFIEGDIRNLTALSKAMNGIRYTFHQAALVSVVDSIERPVDNHEINLTGTLNVLLAARENRVARVVLASSAAVYGNQSGPLQSESMQPRPESPYALAKLAGEHYCAVFAGLYGLETVALRYFNVYGPRQRAESMYSGVISRFLAALRAGHNPTVFGDGLQSRDFVYVADVVAANLLAMDRPDIGRGEVFNIGTGRSSTLLELLDQLRTLTEDAFTVAFRPGRPGDVRHSCADISRAEARLGYHPRYHLDSGLQQLVTSSTSADAALR